MNAYLKLSVGAVAAALAALTVRRQNPDLSMLLGLLGCCLGGLLCLELLEPVLDYAEKLGEKAGLDNTLLLPLLKSAGAALISQLAAAICADAGQSALSKVVELGGAILCLVLSLPLLRAVLSMITQLAGS